MLDPRPPDSAPRPRIVSTPDHVAQRELHLRNREAFGCQPYRADAFRRDGTDDREGVPEHGTISARDDGPIAVVSLDDSGIVDGGVAQGDALALIVRSPGLVRVPEDTRTVGGQESFPRRLRPPELEGGV